VSKFDTLNLRQCYNMILESLAAGKSSAHCNVGSIPKWKVRILLQGANFKSSMAANVNIFFEILEMSNNNWSSPPLRAADLHKKSVPVLNTCRSLYYNTDQKRIPKRGVKGRPTMRSTSLPCASRSGNLGSHVQVPSTKWYITASFPESLMRKILPLW